MGLLPLWLAHETVAEDSCPVGATGVSVNAAGLLLFDVTPGSPFSGQPRAGLTIGSCGILELQAHLAYQPACPGGKICVAFSDGRLIIEEIANHLPTGLYTTNVTPAQGIPLIGPSEAANCAGARGSLDSDLARYVVTPANVAAGSIRFRLTYDGATLWLAGFQSNSLQTSSETLVNIAPAPSCIITPANQVGVVPGGSTNLTLNVTGTGPFSFRWTGPGGFTSTNQVVTITNAQTGDAGRYVATAKDFFGCEVTSSSMLTVTPKSPRFTVMSIDGEDFILAGAGGESNGLYTVMTTTNASMPVSLWDPVLTNTFDDGGRFAFTNRIDLSESCRFFRLLLP